jgi:putative ABC transport system permease protein
VIGYHLTESAVLASVGTVVGILLAWWSVRTLVAIDPDVLPRDVQPAISGRLAAMVGGALAAATVAAGLLPAWRAGLLPASSLLAQASVRQAGRGDRRTREWMLGVQVASAVLLLSAAGVVAASFGRLTRVNPGFDPTRVLTLQLAPPARLPDPQARALLVARILERVEQVPGVAAAGTTQTTWQPLSSMSSGVEIEGLPETSDVQVFANIRHVTPGYFTALRVPIEDGRPIDVRDKWGAAPVAMVSRSFADRFWPGQRAVGRKLRRKSPNAPWLTVVGVASDVMDCGLGSPIGPTFYVPYFQQNTATARVTLVVRTESDPVALGSAIQQAVWSADPQQPIDRVRTVEAALEESTAQPRFRAVVLSAFGLTGAVLACVGVYGVAAYAAGRRRRELGLRIALGADPSAVVRLLLRQSMRPVLVGLALGLAIGMVSARWLTSVLPAGERLGMPTMSVMAGILLGCSLLATWIPAARAARLAPMNALRLD